MNFCIEAIWKFFFQLPQKIHFLGSRIFHFFVRRENFKIFFKIWKISKSRFCFFKIRILRFSGFWIFLRFSRFWKYFEIFSTNNKNEIFSRSPKKYFLRELKKKLSYSFDAKIHELLIYDIFRAIPVRLQWFWSRFLLCSSIFSTDFSTRSSRRQEQNSILRFKNIEKKNFVARKKNCVKKIFLSRRHPLWF